MSDRAKSRKNARPKSPAVVEPAAVVAVVARTSAGRILRSLGQQLLCELPGSSAEIARRTGYSKQLIAQYRSGDKMPSAESQRKLEAAFPSVRARSWSDRPQQDNREAPSVLTEHVPGPHEQAISGTLGEFAELLEEVRRIRRDPNSLAGERLKAMQLSESLLARRAKLERDAVAADDELEARLCQMPRFQRFEANLMRALGPHPEAMRAVLEAMEAL